MADEQESSYPSYESLRTMRDVYSKFQNDAAKRVGELNEQKTGLTNQLNDLMQQSQQQNKEENQIKNVLAPGYQESQQQARQEAVSDVTKLLNTVQGDIDQTTNNLKYFQERTQFYDAQLKARGPDQPGVGQTVGANTEQADLKERVDRGKEIGERFKSSVEQRLPDHDHGQTDSLGTHDPTMMIIGGIFAAQAVRAAVKDVNFPTSAEMDKLVLDPQNKETRQANQVLDAINREDVEKQQQAAEKRSQERGGKEQEQSQSEQNKVLTETHAEDVAKEKQAAIAQDEQKIAKEQSLHEDQMQKLETLVPKKEVDVERNLTPEEQNIRSDFQGKTFEDKVSALKNEFANQDQATATLQANNQCVDPQMRLEQSEMRQSMKMEQDAQRFDKTRTVCEIESQQVVQEMNTKYEKAYENKLTAEKVPDELATKKMGDFKRDNEKSFNDDVQRQTSILQNQNFPEISRSGPGGNLGSGPGASQPGGGGPGSGGPGSGGPGGGGPPRQ